MNLRKIIALVLVFALCLSLIPSYAFAVDDEIVVLDEEAAFSETDDSGSAEDVYLDEQHNLVYYPATAATCTQSGNRECWVCEDCGRFFADEACTVETSFDALVIPALGHDFVEGVCTVCGAADPDFVAAPAEELAETAAPAAESDEVVLEEEPVKPAPAETEEPAEAEETVVVIDGLAEAETAIYATGSDVVATPTNVAQIGDTEYATLQEAISAAKDGETITLLKDIEVVNGQTDNTKGIFEINKSITIEGNGKTIKVTGKSENNSTPGHVFNVTASNVEIKNLTIDGGKDNSRIGIHVYDAKDVKLDTVEVKNCGGNGVCINKSIASATDLKASGNAWGGVNVDSGDGTASLTIGESEEGKTKVDYVYIDKRERHPATVNVTGGTYIAVFMKNPNTEPTIENIVREAGQIMISSGSFDYQVPLEYCAANYMPSAKGENNKYTVASGTAVASITRGEGTEAATSYFATLADAVTAAQDGDTITLIADTTETENITVDKTLTIDLNGKTVSGVSDNTTELNFISVNGEGITLTIKDSAEKGTLDSKAFRTICILNGNVTVNGGTIKGRTAVRNDGTGTVTVTDGTLQGDAFGLSMYSKGNIYINGGTISSGYDGVYNEIGGKVVITEGKISGTYKAVENAASISGGVFNHAVQDDQCAAGYIPAMNKDEATNVAYPYTVANAITVTFNPNGGKFASGTDAPKTVIVPQGDSIPTADIPTGLTKPGDPQYTYTFDGWATSTDAENPETIPAVEADVTYYAHYAKTVNKYAITWNYGTGTDTTMVEYNQRPTHTDVTKPDTVDKTYTFAGWINGDNTYRPGEELPAVTGDVIYTATFTDVLRSYTITWENDDSSVIDTTTVEYGSVPTHTDAAKAADAQYTYTFAGWINGDNTYKPGDALPAVDGDATYTATYTNVLNKYKVTWVNYDGTVLASKTDVEYGTTVKYPGTTPTKAETDEYTYTFSGWNPAQAEIHSDTTYTATYTSTKRSYTITWKNDYGSDIDTTTVEYGKLPTHTDAAKAADAQYTYTFAGWVKDGTTYKPDALPTVTGEATYTATYTNVLNKYKVTWKNEDGTVLASKTDVEYGTTVKYPGTTPTKAETDEYTYTFSDWNPAQAEIHSDTTYTATYTNTKRSYKITWKNDYGSDIDTTTVEYGSVPTHTDAAKAADAQYTYTFAGWVKDGTTYKPDALPTVTGEATYTATYTNVLNKYKVTWVNYDGTELASKTDVEYGTTVKYPGTPPTKEATAEYTYTFSGWTPAEAEIQGDTTYTATYTSTKRSYKITWKNGDAIATETDVEYGETPDYTGATPEKATDDQFTYEFDGWATGTDAEKLDTLPAVHEDVSYFAVFKATPNPAVASITKDGKSSYYASLKTAVDAATATDTIKLIADTNEAEIITVDKTLTIDLNGKTVSGVSSNTTELNFISVNGEGITLTIEDSDEKGTLDSNAWRTINVFKGNLTVNNGTIKGTIAVRNEGNGTVTINDGTLQGINYGVYMAASGYLYIRGGTITSSSYDGVHNGSGGKVVITEGKISGTHKAVENATSISGGVFNHAVQDDQCAAGYIPAMNKDEATKAAYPYTVAKAITVTFDPNGGKFASGTDAPKTVIVPQGDSIPTAEIPANPTRTGYTFKEWQLNGSAFDFATPITENITLTAAWNGNDLKIATITDVTYTGEAHKPVVTVTDAKTGDTLTAGTDYTVSYATNTDAGLASVTVTGIDSYEGRTATATFTINPAPVTVTITGKSAKAVYTGTEQSVEGYTATVTDARYTAADFNYTGSDVATGTDAGEYSVSLDAGKFVNINNNYKAEFVIATGSDIKLTINPAPITVTITGKSETKIYTGEEQKAEGYTATATDTHYTTADFKYIGSDVATGTDVGEYSVSLVVRNFVNSNQNFAPSFKLGTPSDIKLTINPAPVTVTVTGKSATTTYTGEKQSVSGYDVEISDPKYTDGDFTFTGAAIATGTDAGEYSVSLDAGKFENTNTNYKAEFVIATGSDIKLTIEKAKITIKADDKTKTYGESDPALTATATDVPAKGVAPAYTLSRAEGENVGSYAITVTPGTNPNYDVQLVPGTLTIAEKDVTVTITGNSATTTYTGEEQSVKGFTATATDARYTAADFNYTGSDVATGTDAGEYSVSLDAGKFENTNTNYKAEFVIATGSDIKLTINPAPITVTITGKSETKTYTGEEQSAEGYTVNAADGYTEKDFTYSGAKAATGTDAGVYSVSLDVGKFANNNKNFDPKFELGTPSDIKLTITRAAITIKADDKTKAYGEKDPALTATATDVPAKGAEPQYTLSRAEGDAPGTYAITVTPGVNPNYDVQTVSGTLTIGKAPAKYATDTSIPTAKTPIYNGVEQLLVTEGETDDGIVMYSLDGVNYRHTIPTGVKAGTYTVWHYIAGDANHTDSEKAMIEVTIAKAPVTVTVTGKSDTRTYSGLAQTVEGYDVSISNSLYTEGDFSFSGTKAATGKDAGEYPMGLKAEQFTNNNDNFDVSFATPTDGKLTIERAPLVIETGSKGKTYDGTPLVNSEVSFESVNSETLTVKAIGTQTDVGISPNRFLITWDGTAKKDNYAVTGILGTLTVVEAPVTVTITGHTSTISYDGKAHTVSGYDVSSTNDLYKEEFFTFSGVSSVTNTRMGEYPMGLKAEQFTNNNANFDVDFKIAEDGKLTIVSADEIIVTIKGNTSEEFTYNGRTQNFSVSNRYSVEISSPDYKKEDFTFSGSKIVQGRDVGTYPLGLKAEQFTNNNANFPKVTFNVTDGSLTITPATLTVTAEAKEKFLGEEDPELTYKVEKGLQYQDTAATVLTGKLACEHTEAVGTYEIKQGSLSSTKNYTIQYNPANLTIKPSEVKYTVTFKNDAEVFDTQEVVSGERAVYPDKTPVKEGYSFDGWYQGDVKFSFSKQITENTTLTAKWAANKFMVIWRNDDNSILDVAAVAYGEKPTAPTAPTKAADEANTYTFSGWTPAIAAVTGDTTYTATFASTARAYDVAWTWAEDASLAEAVFTAKDDKTFTRTLTASGAAITEQITKPAACEEAGEKTKTAKLSFGGKDYTDSKTVEIAPIGHEWGTPTDVWAADNSSVTASRSCVHDPKHVETETVKTTARVTKEATCEEKGETTYTAVFTNPAFGTLTRTAADIPALGHKYELSGWTWEETKVATATFICKNDSEHVEKVNATITKDDSDPTKFVFTAKVIFKEKEYTDKKETAREYTVTFNTDGGTEIKPQVVAGGENAVQPDDPEKGGYNFTGWTLNGETYDFKTPVISDITLTAVFEKIPYVTGRLSMQLRNNFVLNYYVDELLPGTKPSDYTVSFNGGAEKTLTRMDSNGFAEVAAFSATQLLESIPVVVKYQDKVVFEDQISVRRYCDKVFDKYGHEHNNSIVGICEAALDYGSSAQLYVGDEGELANGGNWYRYPAEEIPYTEIIKSAPIKGITNSTASLQLGSAVTPILYAYHNKKAKMSDYTFLLNGKEADGKNIVVTDIGNAYVVRVGQISITNLKNENTFTIIYHEGQADQATYSVTASPTAYMYACYQADPTSRRADLCYYLYNYYVATTLNDKN